MSLYARTSISIPAELKDRMESAPVRVNWSAVAARAFEAELAAVEAGREPYDCSGLGIDSLRRMVESLAARLDRVEAKP
jgi:hypothetical protein